MATILLLDTSDAESIAAVSVDGAVKSERRHSGARDGAAMINFLVGEVLADAGLTFGKLDAVSVVAGPGSYTGVRVAVAAAKGFCFTLDLPLIGHNKLDLLASEAANTSDGRGDFIISALPARASEWFAGIYGKAREVILAPRHMTEQDLVEAAGKLGGTVHWIGSLPPETELSVKCVSNESGYINSEVWARAAQSHFDVEQFENTASFVPFYLKAPFVTVLQPKTP